VVLDFFKIGSAASTIEEVEATLVRMVRDGRAVYDAATGAVFGGGKSKQTKREVRSTDKGINIAQQEVRRALVMHASVTGAVDLPVAMAYMSIVKDVERIGDYAKNLYDLAKYGVNFVGAGDFDDLERYHEAVGQLIDDAADVFEERDTDKAQRLIDKADGFLKDYDRLTKAAYKSDGPASEAVARALYYRYLKRITAHVMNLMTSLVMPIDRLDYYDEAPEDRD
jgi:phosphate transport system protein